VFFLSFFVFVAQSCRELGYFTWNKFDVYIEVDYFFSIGEVFKSYSLVHLINTMRDQFPLGEVFSASVDFWKSLLNEEDPKRNEDMLW
jgi:hypothetical protein